MEGRRKHHPKLNPRMLGVECHSFLKIRWPSFILSLSGAKAFLLMISGTGLLSCPGENSPLADHQSRAGGWVYHQGYG